MGMAILILFPKAMYPTTPVGGLDRLLAITVLAISWTDIALAALAYHNDVGSTVRARSIVQPWVITIAALALSFVPIMVSRGDGLIIAYVLSMVAALLAALIPLLRCYGLPHGWTPDLGTAWGTAVRNAPVAAADTVEWASRRIDLAVLGGMEVSEARRLKELEDENRRLKHMVAELSLDKEALKAVIRKNGWSL